MRRLAVQSRDDTYSSLRDYQKVEDRRAVRIATAVSGQAISLALRDVAERVGDPRFLAWGGYVKADRDCSLESTFFGAGYGKVTQFEIGQTWRRIGGIIELAGRDDEIVISLKLAAHADWLDVWGLVAAPGRVTQGDRALTVAELDKSHLAPEAFYLDHASALELTIDDEASSRIRLDDGDLISVKKCSYCGRYLPLDLQRLGALAFHKHNAKATNHQNECRACKKLRINDSFNPLRTTDQLHESSVITRERKVLLREPEILQQIKERTGSGLKSQIWERFGRCCFRCGVDVALDGFQLDHTRPLAYLWPIDEHATCLCATCNNEKKEKFPVDFYTDRELENLSSITGLPLAQLREKKLNQSELERILADLPGFARSWEARTFAATARKISELRPDIDLMQLLRDVDADLADALYADISKRPLPVDLEED